MGTTITIGGVILALGGIAGLIKVILVWKYGKGKLKAEYEAKLAELGKEQKRRAGLAKSGDTLSANMLTADIKRLSDEVCDLARQLDSG